MHDIVSTKQVQQVQQNPKVSAEATVLWHPRVYIDHQTIIREVSDKTQLRKGDHCLTTLNIFRCVHPQLDYFVSLLGAFELFHYYSHFVVLDDVDHVDNNGIPRTKGSDIVTIFDHSHTLMETYEECRGLSQASLWRFPMIAGRFLAVRSNRPNRKSLAEYGDMPHLFRVEEHLTDDDRERIVEEAERVLEDHYALFPEENFRVSNCDASVRKGEVLSASVTYLLWNMFRLGLAFVGLAFLHFMIVKCYSHYCLISPVWALVTYYTFTIMPVALQAGIQFSKLARNVSRSYLANLLSRDDLYHLLLKELCRSFFGGGLAVFVFYHAPAVARRSSYPAIVSLAAAFAYMFSDMLYCFLAQGVSRFLVLTVGRFWLIGGGPLSYEQEKDRKCTLM
jgi:hypothetical protein